MKEYTNGEVTVVWKPEACIHSRICFTGLPGVFNPRRRPWIDMSPGETERIIGQVKNCPSGALSYYINDAPNEGETPLETVIEVLPQGPLLVYGTVRGKARRWRRDHQVKNHSILPMRGIVKQTVLRRNTCQDRV